MRSSDLAGRGERSPYGGGTPRYGEPVPTTVLLADDDDRFRGLVRAVLEDDGYLVVADVGDADAAVAGAVEHDPDVVVLDLVLPGADGLSAVRELTERRPGRPVLVMSSLFDPAVEQEAARLGATYLDKTRGIEELETAIDAAVERA